MLISCVDSSRESGVTGTEAIANEDTTSIYAAYSWEILLETTFHPVPWTGVPSEEVIPSCSKGSPMPPAHMRGLTTLGKKFAVLSPFKERGL